MEEQLECASPLSLLMMAQRAVIAQVLCASDIFSPISIFQPDTHKIAQTVKDFRENVEPKIKDKLLALDVPESLTEPMIEMAKAMGLQIKRWKDRQDYHFMNETEDIVLSDYSKFHWTMAGFIDYRRTATNLVRCDTLDVVLRYKLACLNCLEKDISRLWEKLPEEAKVNFYGIVCYQKRRSPSLHLCWPHFLNDELENLGYLWRGKRLTSIYQWRGKRLTSIYQWAFDESVAKCNKIATEYFFQKLSPSERGVSLKKSAVDVPNRISDCVACSDELSDVFFYLFSVMTIEERDKMFTPLRFIFNLPRALNMLSFLDFPWPDLFVENVHKFWKIIPPVCYMGLYLEMFFRFEARDQSLLKHFPELFKQSPPVFKEQFLNLLDRPNSGLMQIFLRYDNLEDIRTVLRNVDVPDREKLVFSDRVTSCFQNFILAGKWRTVEVCLREATLSEDRWKSMKEIFRRTDKYRGDESKKMKFEKFFKYIETTYEEKMAKKHKLTDCYVRIKRLRPLPGDEESVSRLDLREIPFLS